MIDKISFQKVMIDTSPFIYYIEKHKQYFPVIKSIFAKIDNLEISSVTSTITLIEVLVHPKRESNFELEKQYLDILSNNANLEIIPLDASVARKAAEIRAIYNIKVPDAIQLATGINNNCNVFLTNDYALKKVDEIRVIIVSDLLEGKYP
ncbi:MAG: type II toxin-antitoxin system VapC family toxin [Calditrichaeota bacterium]|nr:type II toxin-antitoxin system VapC family toxin [Calditrichota bacterium]